jgi:nondiscriminating aspartyl-tRNA synthetase
VEGFRSALRRRRFSEIFSSKIVAEGTEGGANLFPIRYFERVAYLAQSSQFYNEHGVVGLDVSLKQAMCTAPHLTPLHAT